MDLYPNTNTILNYKLPLETNEPIIHKIYLLDFSFLLCGSLFEILWIVHILWHRKANINKKLRIMKEKE